MSVKITAPDGTEIGIADMHEGGVWLTVGGKLRPILGWPDLLAAARQSDPGLRAMYAQIWDAACAIMGARRAAAGTPGSWSHTVARSTRTEVEVQHAQDAGRPPVDAAHAYTPGGPTGTR